jgi:hypothetical protein
MRCYYHQEKEAVGSCRSCGRGLCPDCAADVGKALACRGHCEEDVRAYVALVHRNDKLSPQSAKILKSGRQARYASAAFILVFGVIFAAYGFSNLKEYSFMAVLGVCFLVYGVFMLWQTRKSK